MSVNAASPTIALAMIVRDEAEVIERCIESVRPLVSAWTICDTGSSDATPELIAKALGDLPGELHRTEWRDFGANRSELMELAAGKADYLLLLDADMTVEQLAPLPTLDADAYLLRHVGELDYAIPRLVRADPRWRYEGATHEYLARDGEFTQEELAALVVHHHGDGGSRETKLERDRGLLEAELERDPESQRATFYLAQTERDAGNAERAIELYRRRIQLGGWDEEVFYAAFQVAMLTADTDPEVAIGLYLDAYERRPSRAEPLHQLAYLCREAGRHRAAYMFAKRGLELDYPDDKLFVHRDAYEWGLLFELSIAAFWIGELDEGMAACEALLERGDLPPGVADAVRQNHDAYRERGVAGSLVVPPVQPAPLLADLMDSVRPAEIQLDVEPDWPRFNPSIAADGDGFRAVVRTASYVLEDERYYRMLGEAGKVQTVNYLARFDGSLELTGVESFIDASEGPELHESMVEGYEDLRLFALAGRWYALATVRDRNPENVCEIVLLGLDGPRIESVTLLPGPTPGRHEKNWMPFVVEDRLRIVYSCGPTVVLECDVATGELSEHSRHEAPAHAEALRGGSQGVAVAGGHLFVVHDVVALDGRRIYGHRFVRIDAAGRLTDASPRFSFAGERIEHCAGMARRGEDVAISFGVLDRSARLALCGLDDVLALLEPADVQLH